MAVHLPDLGDAFQATPINVRSLPGSQVRTAVNAQFPVEPGVWLLSGDGAVERTTLPSHIARVGFNEFHVNERRSYPDLVLSLSPTEYPAGAAIAIRVRVADDVLPDEVSLWVRPAGVRFFGKPIAMTRAQGNDYVATLAPDALSPGLYEYVVSTKTGARVTTFPGAAPLQPCDWPFHSHGLWSFHVTPAGTTVRLLDPKQDYSRLSFVRPGEQYRNAFFQIVPGESADESALSIVLPDLGKDTPERYAGALYIGDTIAARKADVSRAQFLDVKLRAADGERKAIQVTLIEQDGSAWSTDVIARHAWSTVSVPLSLLHISRSIHIPSPFPGLWDYWRDSPAQRGGPGDHISLTDVERLQLTVTRNSAGDTDDDARGAAVESIKLRFPGEQQ
jgi:hypothetical protein